VKLAKDFTIKVTYRLLPISALKHLFLRILLPRQFVLLDHQSSSKDTSCFMTTVAGMGGSNGRHKLRYNYSAVGLGTTVELNALLVWLLSSAWSAGIVTVILHAVVIWASVSD